jgi:hypothetical protein
MPPKNKERQRDLDQEPDLNIDSAIDATDDNLRRIDSSSTLSDSLLPNEGSLAEEEPIDGGFRPTEDGGNSQHPIHDEDQEDATPSDYEREIDRVDAGTRSER